MPVRLIPRRFYNGTPWTRHRHWLTPLRYYSLPGTDWPNGLQQYQFCTHGLDSCPAAPGRFVDRYPDLDRRTTTRFWLIGRSTALTAMDYVLRGL